MSGEVNEGGRCAQGEQWRQMEGRAELSIFKLGYSSRPVAPVAQFSSLSPLPPSLSFPPQITLHKTATSTS